MYLEDYSRGSFFLLCPRNCLFMYLLSYYRRYLFIYLFIEPASAYDFNVNWPLA